MLLPLVNLLLYCTISTSVHLPDMFSVLLSFLDVREDETAAHKLCFKISSPCCVGGVCFLSLVLTAPAATQLLIGEAQLY